MTATLHRIRMTATLAAALLGLGFTCGGGPTPSSQTCEAAQLDGTVDAVDIGRFVDSTFTAYQDGDVVPLTYGGQGFPMLVLNLRLEGSAVPGCVPQTTVVRNGAGEIEGSEELPLTTRMVLPGTWITGDAYLVSFGLYGGDYATIESTVGGVTRSIGVWIEYVGALPDAGISPRARTSP